MRGLYQYVYNLAVALDQLVNTLTGGDPDETISSRVGKSQANGRILGHVFAVIINALFYVLDGFRWDHCKRSIDPAEGANALWRVRQ